LKGEKGITWGTRSTRSEILGGQFVPAKERRGFEYGLRNTKKRQIVVRAGEAGTPSQSRDVLGR